MAPNFRRSRLLHDDPALDSTPAPQSHHHPLVNHATRVVLTQSFTSSHEKRKMDLKMVKNGLPAVRLQ